MGLVRNAQGKKYNLSQGLVDLIICKIVESTRYDSLCMLFHKEKSLVE